MYKAFSPCRVQYLKFRIVNKERLEASRIVSKTLVLVRNWYDCLSKMAKKSPKGSVAISSVDGRFRLRWNHFDELGRQKRFTLSCGMVNATNRTVAKRLAGQIELDIASRNFDPSLQKYRQGLDRSDSITVEALIDRFINAKISPDKTTSTARY